MFGIYKAMNSLLNFQHTEILLVAKKTKFPGLTSGESLMLIVPVDSKSNASLITKFYIYFVINYQSQIISSEI